jgi:hypothetical protein
MYARPHLAAWLAETRAAALRATARAQVNRSRRRARFNARPARDASPVALNSYPPVALNSYPRLCGLPVTVERLPIQAGQSKGSGCRGRGRRRR